MIAIVLIAEERLRQIAALYQVEKDIRAWAPAHI